LPRNRVANIRFRFAVWFLRKNPYLAHSVTCSSTTWSWCWSWTSSCLQLRLQHQRSSYFL